MAKARSPKQKANDKRLGKMAKARAAKGGGWASSGPKSRKAQKAGKKGRKRPSASTIAAMRAGGKRYWAAKRGKPKRPMPLKVLKAHRDRLDDLIKKGGK